MQLAKHQYCCLKSLGSGYFVVNGILTLEAILQSDICDRSFLVMY